MSDLAAAALFVMLHRADGGEVLINPGHIASMQAAAPGQPNQVITGEARCAIHLGNGKLVSVRETCRDVGKAIESRLARP